MRTCCLRSFSSHFLPFTLTHQNLVQTSPSLERSTHLRDLFYFWILVFSCNFPRPFIFSCSVDLLLLLFFIMLSYYTLLLLSSVHAVIMPLTWASPLYDVMLQSFAWVKYHVNLTKEYHHPQNPTGPVLRRGYDGWQDTTCLFRLQWGPSTALLYLLHGFTSFWRCWSDKGGVHGYREVLDMGSSTCILQLMQL